MQRICKMLSVACVLALTACAAQPLAPYQPPPRPTIDPLPADLTLKPSDRALCQRLLLIFSASPQTLRESCGSTTGSPSDSKNAGP